MIRKPSRSWSLAMCSGVLALLTSACGGQPPGQSASEVASGTSADELPAPNPLRNAYFGDLHVHTRNSFDAYIFNVRATPDDAYRYAKGESIKHALGYDMRLTDRPLDFLAVTDHAEYLGVLPAINTPGHPFSNVPYAGELFSSDTAVVSKAFRRFSDSGRDGDRLPEFADMEPTKTAWRDIIAAAQRHYQPGKFTTFIGYEYSSTPDGQNLHRNVIFAGDKAPELPFSLFDSRNPEDLWRWMDQQRANGIEALAIPHNSNGSDGRMFERTQWNGAPFDKGYADLRTRNEPLVEVTQVKGTSETHPLLSPNDEWAGFEIMESYIGSSTKVTQFDGGYARGALRAGLEFETASGFNPYKFGLVGASDTHNAAGSFDESDYHSKVGVMDGTPQRRGSVPPPDFESWEGYTPPDGAARYSSWGASGLTGVWAEQNTRESIFASFGRKEVFATTGPRIQVRLFAGYGLDDVALNTEEGLRAAYAKGVPMGGDLIGQGKTSPDFLIWAMRDSHSAPLQRLQMIKAWTDANGRSFEKVFDVACSDGGRVAANSNRCGDNGAVVDLATCTHSEDRGDAEMSARWRDPEFVAGQNALYYVRVLENPTCRWSTWDALRAGRPPSPTLEKTIQERAFTSAIWYIPTRAN